MRWLTAASSLFALVACAAPTPYSAGTESQEQATWIEPVTGMEFVRIPAGSFVMGAPVGELGRQDDEVEHRVTLSRDFFLGRFEVTQEEWRRVMGSAPEQALACGPRCPVVGVDWLQAVELAARLAELSGERFRLPTEAEWEYACRAGTRGPFYFGDDLTSDLANYDGRYPYGGSPPGEYRGHPTPVGSFPPNAFGLHDMHGNVWEWTLDDDCPYEPEEARDPVGVCGGRKVIRGGSWYFNAESARSALRYTHDPRHAGPSLGLRLVRESSPGPH